MTGSEKLAQKLMVTPDEVAKRLEILTEHERDLFAHRCGFDRDGEGRTLEETAEAFNVTRERVRQIETRAIALIRHPKITTP